MELQNIYHLYRRAAFGISPSEANKLVSLTREEVVDNLLADSEKVTPLTIDLPDYEAFFKRKPLGRRKELQKIIRKNAPKHLDYNKAWLKRLCEPTEALNERMTLFWINHFVCRDQVIYFAVQYYNLLRTNALGNFKDFIKQVGKAPSMMKYLNTNTNSKDHPNENFARELLELFTVGEGQYSEKDIKEAARAFTGYGSKLDGSFILRQMHHDFGTKEFMGWTANLDGDDIVNIICSKRKCAQFISRKLYAYFVNSSLNDAHIDEMTDVFYEDYDIKKLMRFMLTSDWFYAPENLGAKIKSPVDLLTSIYRVVPFNFEKPRQQLFVQRLLGQALMEPPNVAGWPGGRHWINTNTLMVRLKLPSVFLGNGLVPSDSPQYAYMERGSFGDRLSVNENWKAFDAEYGSLDEQELIVALCAGKLEVGTLRMLEQGVGYSRRELSLQLMSTPEFQLT
ncbi:MAG: DUF1800 domain-containing protein [Flavobacteriaceae bacterium]|nr:DUF1800 domain-containing protein [Flavobacteriaceae bacterium]NNJ83083.1 DUF1800 domain-containing protein [Flavobacteriaceae bacterium]NNK54693.1 DUF1800 domain-containing protein [Flavobacteriaceae bacterium]